MHRLDTFPAEDLITQYRAIFGSRTGRAVLSHMLYDLGAFLQVTAGDEDMALKNYGMRLLAILGGGEVGEDSIDEFTKRLMMQPLPKKGEDQ